MFYNRILSKLGLGPRHSPYYGYARRGGLASLLPLALLAWRNRDRIGAQLRRLRAHGAQGTSAFPQAV